MLKQTLLCRPYEDLQKGGEKVDGGSKNRYRCQRRIDMDRFG